MGKENPTMDIVTTYSTSCISLFREFYSLLPFFSSALRYFPEEISFSGTESHRAACGNCATEAETRALPGNRGPHPNPPVGEQPAVCPKSSLRERRDSILGLARLHGDLGCVLEPQAQAAVQGDV